jgi:very-short-patch-repair endonuclease
MMRQHRVHPELLQRAKQLRSDSAPAEQILWARLRDRQVDGIKFRRQIPINRFIVDFYCAAARLIIELDGDSHSDREAYDAQRTVALQQLGFTVIRFDNSDVFDHLDTLLNSILEHCNGNPAPHPSPLPSVPGRGDIL